MARQGCKASVAYGGTVGGTPQAIRQLIREQIAKTREQLGANVLTVTGLDGPVLVRQLDALSVELYLDYQLSATLEKLPDSQGR